MSVHVYVVLLANDGDDVVTASAELSEWTCLDQAADLLSAARRGTRFGLHVYDPRTGRHLEWVWHATGRVSPATRERQRAQLAAASAGGFHVSSLFSPSPSE